MKSSIHLFTFALCYLLSAICPAQIQFQATFNLSLHDWTSSIIQIPDGSFVVVGGSEGSAGQNPKSDILKIDGGGNLQWNKTIAGTHASSVVRSSDGGYVLAGEDFFGQPYYADLYIAKLDNSGALLWSTTIGGTYDDVASTIIRTSDGGYAVAGYSFGTMGWDFYIVKINGIGNLQWSRTFGGTGNDGAYSIVQTTDGGYAVAGSTTSFGAGGDMYIVKLDSIGAFRWNRTIGGSSLEQGNSIIQTTDGGYAIAGLTSSFGAGSYDMYIVKLDGSGVLQWSRTVGGAADDRAYCIVQSGDGGYVVAGNTYSFVGYYLVKLNGSGNLQWSKVTLGSYAYSIIRTAEGGYAVVGSISGSTGSDMNIVKFDSGGNTCSGTFSPQSITGSGGIVGNPTPNIGSPSSTVSSPFHTFSTGGSFTLNCSLIGIQPISNELPNSSQLYQNYPNPFNPNTKIRFDIPSYKGSQGDISIKIYNVLGGEVATLVNQPLQPGTYEVEWDASNYPSGVYYYKLTSGDFSETNGAFVATRKMVLVK